MNKKLLIGILGMGVIALGSVRTAEASALLNMSDSLQTKSCDTSAAIVNAVGGNCATVEGFIGVVAGANQINFSGTVGGYNVSFAFTSGTQPGLPTIASVQLTNVFVSHTAVSSDLVMDFGGSGFTLPPNPLLLSATQTGNWTLAQAGDVVNLTGYARADNVLGVPGGTSVVSPPCMPTIGVTNSCNTSSPDVSFTRGPGAFALLGRLIVTENAGSLAGYQSTVAVVPAVPEPATILMFGAGLFGLARRARKLKKQV